jgi:hypothetical protein
MRIGKPGYWYDNGWLRFAILIAFGLAAIQLGWAYIQKVGQPLPDRPTYQVVSSGFIEAGQDASVRVSARMLDSKEVVDLHVDDVWIDGQSIHFRTQGEGPTMLSLDVPHGLSERATIELSLAAKGIAHSKIALPVEVSNPSPNFSAVSEEDALSKHSDIFRISVLPEELIMGMTNRVYILVRRPDGTLAANTHVEAAFPSGKAKGLTNDWGVFEFLIQDPSPAFDLGVSLNRGQSTSNEPMRAYGKGLQLTTEKFVVSIGHPHVVKVQSREASVELFCDLRRGKVWRKSWRIHTVKHQATLGLPGLEAGLYQVQCSLHDLKSGEAVATVPIVVSSDGAHTALRTLLLDNKVWFKSSLPDTVNNSPSDSKTQRFWIESLREPPYGAELPRAITLEEDKQQRVLERQSELRTFLPFALLLCMLVMTWFTEINLRRKTRANAQFQALVTEDSLNELGVSLTATDLAAVPYQNSRAFLLILVGVGVLLINVALFFHAVTLVK